MSGENVVMNNVESVTVPLVYAELMFNIIQVVSRRGAILPNEFRPVGELHDFLVKELRIEERLQAQQAASTASQEKLEPVQESTESS